MVAVTLSLVFHLPMEIHFTNEKCNSRKPRASVVFFLMIESPAHSADFCCIDEGNKCKFDSSVTENMRDYVG